VDQSSAAFSQTLDWGIRTVVLLGLPAMAGLIILAEPMLMVLFMHGAFTPEDARLASYSLIAYGSGLLSFMLVKVFATGFYARQDTKRPVRYGIIAMVSNMVLNLIFAVPFGYVGLALATALSAFINAGLLGWNLHRDGVLKAQPGTFLFLSRTLVATLVMAVLVVYLNPARELWVQASVLERSWYLAGLIAIGGAVYVVTLLISGVRMRHLRSHG